MRSPYKKYLQVAIRRHNRRIAELTESINGTAQDLYHHHVRELQTKLNHHTKKRSNLIKKVGIVL